MLAALAQYGPHVLESGGVMLLTPPLCAVAGLVLGLAIGYATGRAKERRRCGRLCEQSFGNKQLSATARRIYRSILDGRTTLISEDEFFGKETP
jgi:membrane protein DedA with SNARE-associated domain